MVKAIILFSIGLVCLIFGGDWFVDGACDIAKRFHIPDLLIGATIVSIGTTLPEVMVSTTAAIQDSASIAYGNAIGSCICNVSLIAAITLAVSPSDFVDTSALKVPTLFFFIAAIVYSVVSYLLGEFSRITGFVLLSIFVVYMVIQIRDAFSRQSEGDENEEDEDDEETSIIKSLLLLIVGAALIANGANLLVDNTTIIAEGFGVPDSVIAITLVALGTSLPELVTAITSLIKGHGLLSLGNIIGANLFNLVLVSGMAIAISPFEIPAENQIWGLNAALVVDIPLMFIVMLILVIPAFKDKRLYRWQGISLLCIYAAYTIFQFFL